MRRLRDPAEGCPWDREQDFASIAPYTIEEAYEVAEAIARGEPRALEGELGDLLFQVVFHAQMGAERQWFDFASVADAIADKLTERHPHVFARRAHRIRGRTESRVGRTQGARTRGARRQAPERTRRCAAGAAGAGARRKARQTCRARGLRLAGRQRRARQDRRGAARNRSAWPTATTRIAPRSSATCCSRSANWARHLEVDPEEALRLANAKFERRFRAMEKLAAERALVLKSLTPADLGWALERGQEAAEKAGDSRRSVRIHRLLRTLPPRSGYPSTDDGGFMSISSRKIRGDTGGRGHVGGECRCICPGPLRRSSVRPWSVTSRVRTTGRYDDRDDGDATTTPAWSTSSRWSPGCASALRSANAGMKPASTIVVQRQQPAAA